MTFLQIYDATGRRRSRGLDQPLVINNRHFRVVRRLVGGGNGDVFLCEELQIGAPVPRQFALKVLTKNRENRVDRFRNEVEILSSIDHPYILKVIGNGDFDVEGVQVPWMLMELGGYNLDIHVTGREWVQAHGPITGRHFKIVADQMCQAVAHLHSIGLIHRDIKPANFVWTEPNSLDSVSLIDLGLAKRLDANVAGRPFDNITLENETIGPRMLFSPELCDYATDKSTVVDHRSDLWQLARVFWFLATGHLSTGRPSRKLDPFGGNLHAIADVMCNDDPADRLQTSEELRARIQELPE